MKISQIPRSVGNQTRRLSTRALVMSTIGLGMFTGGMTFAVTDHILPGGGQIKAPTEGVIIELGLDALSAAGAGVALGELSRRAKRGDPRGPSGLGD